NLNDHCALRSAGKGACQTLKLGYSLFPGHRTCIESLVVLFLYGKYSTVFERYLYATGHLCGEAFTECLVRLNCYLLQQGLYILAHNALRYILRWGYIAVQ